jgi:hypothetical protein
MLFCHECFQRKYFTEGMGSLPLEGLCDLVILTEGLHDRGRRVVTLFQLLYTMAFFIQLRNNTGNLSQGSWLAEKCRNI